MRYLRILVGVLRIPRYAAAAAAVAAVVFTGAVWLPNTSLIVAVLQSSSSLLDKLTFLGTLYGSIGTNFTLVSATYTTAIAILFGVQIALLGYYIVKARANAAQLKGIGSTSVGGLISGALGIGCAACGTFILTTVLAVFGAAGFVAFLPFGGEEFGFIGVALLIYSMYIVLKKLDAPFVCPI